MGLCPPFHKSLYTKIFQMVISTSVDFRIAAQFTTLLDKKHDLRNVNKTVLARYSLWQSVLHLRFVVWKQI